MISFDDLKKKADTEVERTPQSFVGALVINILVGLVVRYIYDRCISNRSMSVARIKRRSTLDRMRLKRIIRELARDPQIERAWSENNSVRFDPTRVYMDYGDKVFDVVMNVGKSLRQEELE